MIPACCPAESSRARSRASSVVVDMVELPGFARRTRDGGSGGGCHGPGHPSPGWLDAAGFARDLGRSLEALASAGAEGVDAFRAPYFSLNARTAWALPVLEQHGIATDSS